MSMFVAPSTNVAEPYEVISAIATRLAASENVVAALASSDDVYAHRAPAEKPTSGKWIVVREMMPMGGQFEQTNGRQRIVVHVMTECLRSTQNADIWHSALHNRIAESLLDADFNPTLTLNRVAVPIASAGLPSPPRHDEDSDTLYSTAAYVLVVEGV